MNTANLICALVTLATLFYVFYLPGQFRAFVAYSAVA